MEHAKYIVRFLIQLVTHPQELWQYLASDDIEESKPDYLQQRFYLPLLGFSALVIFLCEGFHNKTGVTFDLQYGMKQMVPSLVAFLVGPYVAMMVLKGVLVHYYKMPSPSQSRMHLFVFVSTSFLMALMMLESFIPQIRFFSLIVVYLLYITWTGAVPMLRIDDRHRWVFAFLSALVIYFSSHLFISIVQRMQG